MHGQTEQIHHQPPPSAGFADPPGARGGAGTRTGSLLRQFPGLGLYLASLVLELPALLARGLLAYLGAAILGEFLALGLSAETFAWVAASAPLALSAAAFALPGQGRVWRRRSGARRPSTKEGAALDDALRLLGGDGPTAVAPRRIYVLDDPLPSAAVRGCTVMLSRGLLESEALAPVLAHELGHVGCLDGVLSEALNRLCIWRGPVAQPVPRLRPEHQLAEDVGELSGGAARRFARAVLRLAAGGLGQRLLAPLWAAYWRGREYAADAHAANLGQAEDLARYLSEEDMPFDVPVPHLFASPALHPPAALRVERLLRKAH